jgi:polo-like kinase 1
MLSSETKVVTYVNKKGERSTYPLSSAMESANTEMVKRLKYTKDILTHMLNANTNTAKPGTGPEGIGGPGLGGIESSKGISGSNKFSATDRTG